METETIRSYLKDKLLNSGTSIQWPEEENKAFEDGKKILLMFCDYLESERLIEGNKFTYKAGKDGDLKEAVTFSIFSEAISCYISALYVAWRGHTAAATMLIRRIYELLVDLSFMFQRSTKRRLYRFVIMAYVSRYIRLRYLKPNLSQKKLIRELRAEIGPKFDELRKNYLKYRRKFEYRKKNKQTGKFYYVYSGDWSFGLIQKNKRSSIAEKAKSVGLGGLHYKLSYGILSSKTHVDSWYIGSKVSISDEFLQKITFPILPDKERHFKPVITCGVQYLAVLFTVLAKVFNLSPTDKDILDVVDKIKGHEDYKEFFKKVKIVSQSNLFLGTLT